MIDFSQFKPRTDTSPLVSVIVPCYNVEEYIDQCLNSIIDNGYSNIELICIDDRSTDSTVEHIKAIQKSHPCIQLYRNETDHNIYGGACRNIGLEHARGKYVYFCDSDDYILPGLIKECVQKCESLNAQICCFKYNLLNTNTNKLSNVDISIRWNLFRNHHDKVFNRDSVSNIFMVTHPQVWDKFYLRQYIDSIGARFQEIKNFNDNLFFVTTMAHADTITMIDDYLYVYRWDTPTSVQKDLGSGNNIDSAIDAMRESFKAVDGLGDENILEMFKEFTHNNINYLLKNRLNKSVNKIAISNDLVKLMKEIGFYDGEIRNLLDQYKPNLPLVSVIVPCYNVEKYIDQCLNSVLDNEYSNIEIIAIDDRSTDSTVEHITKLMKNNPCIKLIRNETDHQWLGGGSRNVGLDNANGKYVYFCDSDDYVLPGLISKCVEKCDWINAQICCFNHFELDEQTQNIQKCPFGFQTRLLINQNSTIYNCIMTKNIFGISQSSVWCKFYNREFIESIGARFPSMSNAEDNVFIHRTYIKAKVMTYLDDALYVHRINVSNSLQDKLFAGLKESQVGAINAYKMAYAIVKSEKMDKLVNNWVEWFSWQLGYFETKWVRIDSEFYTQLEQFIYELGLNSKDSVISRLKNIKAKVKG